jgi:NADP-dependent aldehyde dehydrogenase
MSQHTGAATPDRRPALRQAQGTPSTSRGEGLRYDITGGNLIGRRDSRRGRLTFTSSDPRTGRAGAVSFHEATETELADAAALAARAFAAWRPSAARDRAALLRAAAARLEAARETIVSTADAETGLGPARLSGELDRTTFQLRAFAEMVEEGSYVEAIISAADPTAKPAPRPDVRRMLVPIGPVAVFTPSNFPLAFGVAGGDTASALAAGCPVIVKGHPSHPATSEACARALLAAADETGAPDGVLSLLQARGLEIARALVTAPQIQAVAFTGSLNAGRAIHDLAASRPHPIPVYAEMASLNPVFIAPGALAARAAEIAEGLANSITLGTGQFCTKPGLVFVPDNEHGRAFARLVGERVAAREPGVMLSAQLHAALTRQLGRTVGLPGVAVLARSTPDAARSAESGAGAVCGGLVAATDLATFTRTRALHEEHFGPVSLLVRCPSPDAMIDAATDLEGSLTATVHADPADHDFAARLTAALADKVGRLVWNGYPTGVAVTWAMQHGGPYPATTSAAHTSVGATAIRRFLRPVAFQNTPDAVLPEALRNANPLGIQRLVDGRWTREVLE